MEQAGLRGEQLCERVAGAGAYLDVGVAVGDLGRRAAGGSLAGEPDPALEDALVVDAPAREPGAFDVADRGEDLLEGLLD